MTNGLINNFEGTYSVVPVTHLPTRNNKNIISGCHKQFTAPLFASVPGINAKLVIRRDKAAIGVSHATLVDFFTSFSEGVMGVFI